MTPTDDHANREVHRPLALVTPNMEGPDVRALQEAENGLFAGWHLPNHVDEDGELGPHTRRRTNRALELLGADPRGEGAAGPTFTQEEQRLVRNPDSRTPQQKARGKHRVAQAQAAAERHGAGAAAAVKEAQRLRDVTEHPLGSNRGTEVDAFIRFCGLDPAGFGSQGVYWCGCFAAWCAVHAGKAKVAPHDLIHNVVLLNLADAGGHGLERVSLAEAKAGDIVSYTFAHIGLIVADYHGGNLHTIEGNTGQQGLQNNGGGVYEHTDRSPGLVLGIVRPTYS